MSPLPRPDDIDWLLSCYWRLCDGRTADGMSPEWIHSARGPVIALHEMVRRLANDGRRLSIHALEDWLMDVAKLRHEVDTAIGWRLGSRPPLDWIGGRA